MELRRSAARSRQCRSPKMACFSLPNTQAKFIASMPRPASHWVHDAQAHIWGSTLVADGKVYIGTEDGSFFIFAANKEKKVLSQMDLGEPSITPVAANGVLYVQTPTRLYAITKGNDTRQLRGPCAKGWRRQAVAYRTGLATQSHASRGLAAKLR